MRIAALYDIHGNLPALEAVIGEISVEKPDLLIIGGDVIAGPMPAETLALLQEISTQIPTHFIHGNAESELLRYLAGEPVNGLSPLAEQIAPWLAEQLGAEKLQFIATWSSTIEVESDRYGKLLFCHATPQDDITVFTQRTGEEWVRPIFADVDVDVVVCGHTHMQFERAVAGVRVVNAGSIGMPFGHTGADWLLIDDEINFRHTTYDLAAAAARVRKSGYPQAEKFAVGNVLQAPEEEAVFTMLAQLEARQAEKNNT